jgi:hypothetical protein
MVEQDLRLVRLVTRHFVDMQGLYRVLAGLALAISGIVYVVTRSDRLGAATMFGAVALTFLPLRAAQHYYRARFGRVQQGDKTYRVMIVLVVATLVAPQGIQWYWTIVAAHAAWLVLDGRPYRWHMLFEVAAAVFAAITAPSAPVTAQALMPGFAVFGIAAVISGFADHALLVRAMGAMTERCGALGAAQGQERD